MSWKSGVVVSHTGERFGKLVILETFQRKQPSGANVRYCRCKCDCSNEKIISFEHLRSGHTTSCGCVHIVGGLIILFNKIIKEITDIMK